MDQSKIQKCFQNSTIFLTGGTGFIGNLLLEKVLRTLNIKKVFLLIRSKRQKSADERLEEIFKSPIYDGLRVSDSRFMDKVVLVEGNLLDENLGLTQKQINQLIEEVDVVIHCGATVRFTEPLDVATKINVRSTRDVLNISKQMPKLKVFLHVSTAYSNCNRDDIDEIFYDTRISPEKLISIVENLSDFPDSLEALTPSLLGPWPNTYTFSKQLAEELVKKEEGNMPICIVRPSIVTSTINDPLIGFVNNIFGLSGIVLAVSLGYLRTLNAKKDSVVDSIPVDIVVNNIIAAAWNTIQQNESEIKIYNCVSSIDNPLTVGEIVDTLLHQRGKVYSNHMIWYPFLIVTNCKYFYNLLLFFLHALPIYIISFMFICIGKEPWFLKVYKRKIQLINVLKYFTNHTWKFYNYNTRALWQKMSIKDKEMFKIIVDDVNWTSYLENSLKGGKKYLIHESTDGRSTKIARRRYLLLKSLNGLLTGLFIILLYLVLKKLLFAVFY